MVRLSDWLQSTTELATFTEGHRAGPPMRAGGDRRGSALAPALRRAGKLESKTRNRQSELNRAQKHAAPAENGQPEKSPRVGRPVSAPSNLAEGARLPSPAARERSSALVHLQNSRAVKSTDSPTVTCRPTLPS